MWVEQKYVNKLFENRLFINEIVTLKLWICNKENLKVNESNLQQPQTKGFGL